MFLSLDRKLPEWAGNQDIMNVKRNRGGNHWPILWCFSYHLPLNQLKRPLVNEEFECVLKRWRQTRLEQGPGFTYSATQQNIYSCLSSTTGNTNRSQTVMYWGSQTKTNQQYARCYERAQVWVLRGLTDWEYRTPRSQRLGEGEAGIWGVHPPPSGG